MAMPTPEEIEWMEAHINDSLVPDVIACCTISTFFATLAVALRIWSRVQHSSTPKLVVSDWLTILSLVFYVAFTTVFAFSTRYGAGRMMILIQDPYDMRMLAILNINNVILYGVATAFIKGSILALYHAIFPQQGFRIYIWVLGVINFLGAIVIVLVTVLQCQPLEKLWNPMIQGHCIDFSNFSLFNVAYNFVLDILILLAPLPLVKNLNLSRRKKIFLGLNFALGGGACIVAIIRLPFARKVGGTSNPSWDMIPGGMLCVVEVVVAILCASLPVYRPLLRRFAPGAVSGAGTSAYVRSGGSSSGVGGPYSKSEVNTYISSSGHRSLQKGGIAVTDDINMMSHINVDGKWVRISDDDDTMLVHPRDNSQALYVNSSVSSVKGFGV